MKIIGIDLHGTLLDADEKPTSTEINRLKKILKNKPDDFMVYICTGNDLPFVERKLGELLNYFDGCVLETGCSISFDNKTENIIVDNEVVKKIKNLENELQNKQLSNVYKFARRLSSISIFPTFGTDVHEFYKYIQTKVEKSEWFRITYSSVAVDLIPDGYNKYTGLKFIANDDDIIIGIADSINDLELLQNADYSFLPSNYNKKIDTMILHNICNIENYQNDNGKVFLSNYPTTKGVCEILEYLFKKSF